MLNGALKYGALFILKIIRIYSTRVLSLSMENEEVLRFKYTKGKLAEIKPTNELVNNWLFQSDEEDEALLCHYLAKIASKNGLNANHLSYLFPAILRMVKSDTSWTK